MKSVAAAFMLMVLVAVGCRGDPGLPADKSHRADDTPPSDRAPPDGRTAMTSAVGGTKTTESVQRQPNNEIIDDIDDAVGLTEKRKWRSGVQSLQAWGRKRRGDDKRKWGATNSMAVWGKRQDNADVDVGDEPAAERLLVHENEIERSPDADEPEVEKQKWDNDDVQALDKQHARVARKWGAINPFPAWRKRQEDSEPAEKRKWGAHNAMSAWGKRSKRSLPSVEDEETMEILQSGLRRRPLTISRKRLWRSPYAHGPKRTMWEVNRMKTWGKRLVDDLWPKAEQRWNGVEDVVADDDDSQPFDKRAWSSDNSLRIWGKRNLPEEWDDGMELEA